MYRQHLFLEQMTIESNSSTTTSATSHMDYRCYNTVAFWISENLAEYQYK